MAEKKPTTILDVVSRKDKRQAKEGKRRAARTPDEQEITREQYATLVETYGEQAAFSGLKGFTSDTPLLDRFSQGARFDRVRELAALRQGRMLGLNSLGNRKGIAAVKAATKPGPDTTIADSRAKLATQRMRAGRFGVGGGQSATAGLFAPTHLARQRLIRNPLFAGGLG